MGAGLSGATLAERCSRELGMTSLVIDKRDHLGGNCYDYVTPTVSVRQSTARICSTRKTTESGSTCEGFRSGSRSTTA